MHHFIYPSADTYITNEDEYRTKNVGIDELLEVKANTQLYRTFSIYTSSSLSGSYTDIINLYQYSGSVNGDLSGSAGYSTLIVTGSAIFSVSGSFNASSSGYFSGSLSGSLSGSWSGSICSASGFVSNFSGIGNGTFYGTQSSYSPHEIFSYIPSLSRTLLKFDISAISASISNGTIQNTASLSFRLKLKATEVNEVPLEYTIYGYPISQSWEMGNGRYETGGTSLGVNWYYRDYSGSSGSFWNTTSSTDTYTQIDYLTTASNSTESFNRGGGTWYYSVPGSYVSSSTGYCSGISSGSGLIVSQSFGYETSDIDLNVTNIVKSWICGCVPNEGIILMSSLELSDVENATGVIRFFSRDTNTIYTPYIDAQWDDSIYISGSLVAVTESTPYTIVLKNVSREYKFGSTPRINVFCRDKYPLKNFVRGYQFNQFTTSSLLPTSSYYAIKDNESEEMIIDFSDNTKLSCDGNVHYFILDTTSFSQERYYRPMIKVVTSNEVSIIDTKTIFKISR